MIKHFLLLAIRNFKKYLLSSSINAIGLSLAICCALFTFTFIDFFLHVDQFHEKGEHLYLINRVVRDGESTEKFSGAPEPLAKALKSNLGQVVSASNLEIIPANVKFGPNVFEEYVRYVDDDFLEMFSFELASGSPRYLKDQQSIFLSDEAAKKYFGSEDPMGKTISLKIMEEGNEHLLSYIVRGIFKPFPKNASFSFLVLANKQSLSSIPVFANESWGENTRASFIEVKEGTDINEVFRIAKDQYLGQIKSHSSQELLSDIYFEPMLTASLHSSEIRYSVFSGTDPAAFVVLSSLSVLLMLLACINYMNIAIASAGYRLKEIGIRKVVGSSRKFIIQQFLMENVLICFLALLLGLLLSEFLFFPAFESITGLELALNYGLPKLWLFILLLLVIAVVGGAGYPALYISRFLPHEILKGKQKFGGKNGFRKLLLGMQYFVAFITIFLATVLIQNNQYQKTIDWGFEHDGIIGMGVKGAANYDKLATEIGGKAEVTKVAGSRDLIGRNARFIDYKVEDEVYRAHEIAVSSAYLEMIQLQLINGRLLNDQISTDKDQAILVNQAFQEKMHWKSLEDKSIIVDGERNHIIGQVKDFHYLPFYEEIGPLVIKLAKKEDYRYLIVDIGTQDVSTATDNFQHTWLSLFPNDPLNFYYQDQVFDFAFRDVAFVTKLISTISFGALVLTAIGLFGLAAIHLQSRRKEISIRKVLGANVQSLALILNKEFIVLLVVASILAIPAATFAIDGILGSLTRYPVPITYLPYLITALVLIMISVVAVGRHVLRAVTVNPADNLRDE